MKPEITKAHTRARHTGEHRNNANETHDDDQRVLETGTLAAWFSGLGFRV